MVKSTRYLPSIVIPMVINCNQPTADPEKLVVDTDSFPPTAFTPFPSETDQQADTPIPPKLVLEPTSDLKASLNEQALHLLGGGDHRSIDQIERVTEREGWAVTDLECVHHILIEQNGGVPWQVVSHPQPRSAKGFTSQGAAGYANTSTAFVNHTQSDLAWTKPDSGKNMGTMFAPVADGSRPWMGR